MGKKYLEQKIDELGRIIIPSEIMEELNLKEKDAMTVKIRNGEIALYPAAKKACYLCGDHEEEYLHEFGKKHLCRVCIFKVVDYELSSEYYGISERRIDELSRFVLPAPERRLLGVGLGDKVLIYVDDGSIFIKPAVKSCYLCRGEKILMRGGNYHFCGECMDKMSGIANKL